MVLCGVSKGGWRITDSQRETIELLLSLLLFSLSYIAVLYPSSLSFNQISSLIFSYISQREIRRDSWSAMTLIYDVDLFQDHWETLLGAAFRQLRIIWLTRQTVDHRGVEAFSSEAPEWRVLWDHLGQPGQPAPRDATCPKIPPDVWKSERSTEAAGSR